MKKYLSWSDIDRLTNDLSAQIILDCKKKDTTPEETFLCIHAIQRGGYIPGVLLSHKLNIPMADRLNEYYGKQFLVVDDISDTGETLARMRSEIYDNTKIATLHYHKQSVVEPDYWVEEKGDDWIVYPWEQVDSEEIQDYLKETK